MTRKDKIEYLTGVPLNTKCARCGITAKASFNKGAFDTGINHPTYRYTYSFYNYSQFIGKKNVHYCPRCHKETELEKLFDVMEKKGY